MKSFQHQAAVVTGAASGIGEALARQLAAQGARLLLADLDAARLEGVAQSLRAAGASCLAQACDVADAAALQALADTAERELGGADLLVNNAGVALVAPVDSLDPADARWLMDINFWGVVNGCRAFGPQLQARPGRAVVNVSSLFAMVSMPTQSIYNASKAAVRGFSDALREEWRPAGVQVLCVHPGGIRTRIAQQARLGDISSIADSPQALYDNFDRVARTSAEQAAAAIAAAVLSGRTRLLIGPDARLGDWLHRLAPEQSSAWFSGLVRWQRRRLRGGARPP
jgi:NAD(P)-dependent dehydrogenase (short-subunit alcohol dehydrogenase family)